MTFIDQWSRARGEARYGVILSLVAAGSILMTLSAKFQVPLYPVPVSMQTLVAIGLGFALGPRLGGAAVMLYLAQGAAGLPVFAGTPQLGAGLPYMLGPTGGYLIGFLVAAVVAGSMVRAGFTRGWIGTAMVAFVAGASVYIPGLLWLGQFTGFGTDLLATGLVPFVAGDVLKALLAALVFPAVAKILPDPEA